MRYQQFFSGHKKPLGAGGRGAKQCWHTLWRRKTPLCRQVRGEPVLASWAGKRVSGVRFHNLSRAYMYNHKNVDHRTCNVTYAHVNVSQTQKRHRRSACMLNASQTTELQLYCLELHFCFGSLKMEGRLVGGREIQKNRPRLLLHEPHSQRCEKSKGPHEATVQ